MTSRFLMVLLLPSALLAQAGTWAAPPRPYADSGACPFEGCVYRDWVAKTRVVAHTSRDAKAPVAFTIAKGEHVTGTTGVVVTREPGRVTYAATHRFKPFRDSVWVMEPTDTLFLLTYQGEGFSKAWFRGKLYSDFEIASFYTDECMKTPASCGLSQLVMPTTEWWARVRNAKGHVGWVMIDGNFGHMDALGGS